MQRSIRTLVAAVSASALSALTAAAHQPTDQPEGAALLHTRQLDQIGVVLVDQEEMSLYLFEADIQGQSGSEPQSSCYEQCAQAWPPLITEGEPEVHGPLDASLLGTLKRNDGKTQVTYGGWPLYYFASDQSPGHARGHDIEEHGGEWYLVTPEGDKASEE